MFGSSWPIPVACRWADVIFMACVYSGVKRVLTRGVTWQVFCKRQELAILREHLASPPVFDGVRVAHLFSFLCRGFFWLSSSCVLCTQCCHFLCIVHSWLLLRFSIIFFINVDQFYGQWKHDFHKASTAICLLFESFLHFPTYVRTTAVHINWSLVACYKSKRYDQWIQHLLSRIK